MNLFQRFSSEGWVPEFTDLFASLVYALYLESRGEANDAEEYYTRVLEYFSKIGKPCPLALIRYLEFVKRIRGHDAAEALFDDMLFAESEHLTYEVCVAFALSCAWNSDGSYKQRMLKATDCFKKAYGRCRGKPPLDLSLAHAEFFAFMIGDKKRALLELSRAKNHHLASKSKILWNSYENLLSDYLCDFDSLLRTVELGLVVSGKARKVQEGEEEDTSDLALNILSASLFPSAPSVLVKEEIQGEQIQRFSWFTKRENAMKSCAKFGFDCFLMPKSALLEQVLDGTDDGADLRDGGDGPTNHIYRPDVTKMLKFNPNEDVQKKFEVPRVLKAFISSMPPRMPKTSNITTLAESCMRLMVSISLPRTTTEDMLLNVDRRTKAAIEQRKRSLLGSLPSAAILQPSAKATVAPKDELEDTANIKAELVKKEEPLDVQQELKRKK